MTTMISTLLVIFLFGTCLASDVLEYTDSDFNDRIGDHEIILVEFYAPWCGHCKRLAPEYEKAATSLVQNDPPVPLAKVDCIANTEVCGKFGVSGYPTLKIFRNGEMDSDYEGPREADGIVRTMRAKAGPASRELSTEEELTKYLDHSEHGIVGYFSGEESDAAKAYRKVADSLGDKHRFAHTTAESLLKSKGHSDVIVLYQPKRLHNKFEPSEHKYDGALQTEDIKTWISDNLLGLCGHRTSDNMQSFKKPLVIAYYDVDYTKNPKGTNYWRNRVMKVGKKLKDEGLEIHFAVSSSNDLSHELEQFGSPSVGDKPVIAAFSEKEQKFVMKDEFSMDALEAFSRDLLADKLEPYLKSEEEPEDNDKNDVKVVVAKNFDQIVNNPEKDVLIEFYAPWCGHCKSLAPKYDELGGLMKDESGITIAKMDATANDVPSPYEVSGFPTLYFSPKDKKANPLKYNGGREVKDFVKYLSKQATDELSGYSRDGKKRKEEL